MGDKAIQVLSRKEIDDNRWNNCIKADPQGLIYSYTWFLDCMTDEWIGLVHGDYENVMALPVRKKWGIRYVYKPPFTAQLGVFGVAFQPSLPNRFLQALPRQFKLMDYNFNRLIDLDQPGFSVKKEINYILSLQPAYEDLRKNYRENTVRNLEKNKDRGQVIKQETCSEVVRMALKQFAGLSSDTLSAIRKYEMLNNSCPLENRSINYVFTNNDGTACASTSVMRSNGRIYYLLSATTEEGKKLGASHKVTDAIIRDFAGSDMVFDFEGSNIPGIAFFYEGFGAKAEYYSQVHLNRLPLLFRLFKS